MKNKIFIEGCFKSGEESKKGYIEVDAKTGLIQKVCFGGKVPAGNEVLSYGEDELILIGDFNAHSHPEQSLYTDIVDKEWDLGTWCRNTIYKYSPYLEPEHIYYGCLRAFSRMLCLGVTSVMVSFYCHNNVENRYDKEVIRAAKDTGIRLYFGRMNYDIINEDAYEGKKLSQKSYYEDVLCAEDNFIKLLNETQISNVEVAPAVHSIHASSKAAIVNAINLGNKYNKIVQFHLSEDKGDVELSMKLYGLRPIEFLESLVKEGSVEKLDNVMLSDCIWIDDKERDLIKQYNMKVVLNPRMNARIKAGEASLSKFIEAGICPYIGTDGEASNDDLSISGEKSFLVKRYPELAAVISSILNSGKLKFKDGYIGPIERGSYCDLKILKGEKIKDVFVGSRKVVSDGVLITMNQDKEIEQKISEMQLKVEN